MLGRWPIWETRTLETNLEKLIHVQYWIWIVEMARDSQAVKVHKLKHYVESLCGVYSRIARQLGVDRTYVSRVAKGERHAPDVETALAQEFDRTQKTIEE